jgi:hypothetical protein
MTKRGFAVENHDGRRGNRCIGDGEAPAGGHWRISTKRRSRSLLTRFEELTGIVHDAHTWHNRAAVHEACDPQEQFGP